MFAEEKLINISTWNSFFDDYPCPNADKSTKSHIFVYSTHCQTKNLPIKRDNIVCLKRLSWKKKTIHCPTAIIQTQESYFHYLNYEKM